MKIRNGRGRSVITRKLNPENSPQENSTQENSTHENSTHEHATHFRHLLIVIYSIHLYSLVVLLIIYAFDTIFSWRFS